MCSYLNKIFFTGVRFPIIYLSAAQTYSQLDGGENNYF